MSPPIQDNLKGTKKRFTVMKFMADETKEKAKEIATNLISTYTYEDEENNTIPTNAFSFNEDDETMRVIEQAQDEAIIEIRPKFRKPKPSTSNEQGEESSKQAESKEGPTNNEVSERIKTPEVEEFKLSHRIYYILRVCKADEIFVVTQIFNPKSKSLIEGYHYVVPIKDNSSNELGGFKCSSGSLEENIELPTEEVNSQPDSEIDIIQVCLENVLS